MSIPGTVGSPFEPTPAPSTQATPEGPPFVTSVSPNGRYFLDQYGRPLLLHGDSPWALMTLLSPQQAQLWFADRQTQGFNAAIISLIGAKPTARPAMTARRSMVCCPSWTVTSCSGRSRTGSG